MRVFSPIGDRSRKLWPVGVAYPADDPSQMKWHRFYGKEGSLAKLDDVLDEEIVVMTIGDLKRIKEIIDRDDFGLIEWRKIVGY